MANEKSSLCAEQEAFRIVLIGKVGPAKEWAIDTILNGSEKCEEPSETKICFRPKERQRFKVKIEGRDVEIFDTLGLCHHERPDEETMKEIKTYISRDNSGLHGFLVVLDLEPFTQEEKDMVQVIHSSLGNSVKDYMMPLFVRGNELKEKRKTIQQFISENEDLKEFANGCRGKPCVIDHINPDPTEVAELLQQISNMVQENKAEKRSCYTTNMLQSAESSAENRRKMALSVKRGMVVGAIIGLATSFSVDSMIGIPGRIVIGAFVGGLMGIAGMVTYIRVKRCFGH